MTLTAMAMGYFRGRALCAAARLGVADALGRDERSVERLAAACPRRPGRPAPSAARPGELRHRARDPSRLLPPDGTRPAAAQGRSQLGMGRRHLLGRPARRRLGPARRMRPGGKKLQRACGPRGAPPALGGRPRSAANLPRRDGHGARGRLHADRPRVGLLAASRSGRPRLRRRRSDRGDSRRLAQRARHARRPARSRRQGGPPACRPRGSARDAIARRPTCWSAFRPARTFTF